jgi:iron(III) transport system permease protein
LSAWPRSYPIAALIAAAALAPLAVVAWLALGGGVDLGPRTLIILGNTLALTALTAAGSVIVGVPLALLTTYVHLPWRRLWLPLLASPLALPSYLGAFAFFAATGRGGELAILTGVDTPAVSGMGGAAFVLTLYTYPFVLLTTRAALQRLDGNMVDAARTLGMPLKGVLLRIVLPRARNGIAAGALLAALYALSDFGTPAIMGVDTLTRAIYIEYNAFGLDRAAWLSLQLLVLVGIVLALEARVGVEREPPGRHLTLVLSRSRLTAALGSAAIVPLLAVGTPLGVFLAWLLREGVTGFELSYALNSLVAALAAAVVAVTLAVPVAFAASSGRLGRLCERTTYLGFGTPGIVMGTAFVYIGLGVPLLYQTVALLVAAYVLRFLPLAVGSVRTANDRLAGDLVSAARSLGAGPGETFRRVRLPLILPGLAAGGALVFLEAMRELPATLLLGPTGFETLATYLWRVYETGHLGRAAVPGLVLILVSGIALLILFIEEHRRQQPSRD